MSNDIKHPRALAIAKRGESALWDMGDYLIEVAGKPKTDRTNDGSYAKIDEVSTELIEHGYPQFSTGYMARLRVIAHAFHAPHRERSVSWTAHEMAGSPEVLQVVIAAAKAEGRKGVSKRFVQQVMDGMDADQRAKRKGLAIKAQKAADRAAAKGDTKSAERNKERARKLKGAPRRDKSKRQAPRPEDVPMIVIKSKFAADSAEAAALVKRMDREISPHIDDLSKAFIIGSVEELLEIAESFRKLAAKLNRNQTDKRAHLHAVA
jgi:hypothetical protein